MTFFLNSNSSEICAVEAKRSLCSHPTEITVSSTLPYVTPHVFLDFLSLWIWPAPPFPSLLTQDAVMSFPDTGAQWGSAACLSPPSRAGPPICQHSDPAACIPLSVAYPRAWFSGPLPLSGPPDLLLDPIWVFLLHLSFLVPLNDNTRLTNVFCCFQWIIDHRLVNYLAFPPKDCFEVGPYILLTMMFVHTAHWLSAAQAN